MTSRGLVIFDFDGVIADTFDMAYEINATLLPHLTPAQYRSCFEGNIYAADGGARHLPLTPESIAAFFAGYSAHILAQSVYAGVPEAIAHLAATYDLAIVSSSQENLLENFLRTAHLRAYFQEVLGYETDPSKIKKFARLCERRAVTPADCLMITDTLGDVREAAHAGVACLGVTWGYHDRETLQRGAPKFIVSTPAELVEKVQAHFAP